MPYSLSCFQPYRGLQFKIKPSLMKTHAFTFWHLERQKLDNYFTAKLKIGILYFLETINDT